jgi:hypothetical protein
VQRREARCAYALLWDVALLSVTARAVVSPHDMALSRPAADGSALTDHAACRNRSKTGGKGRVERIVM